MEAAASVLDTSRPVPVNVVEAELSAEDFFKRLRPRRNNESIVIAAR